MDIYNRDKLVEFLEMIEIPWVSKYNPHNESVIKYANIPSGFDIETTSTYTKTGNKFAFMYEFTFGLIDENFIVYGRTWDEFLDICDTLHDCLELNEENILIIYVHNLSYEFQFMRKFFNWVNVFSIDDRKPIKALTDKGIEFRDSYILSGYGLEKLADNLTDHTIEKLVGSLDYDLIRTYKTHMSEQELNYCRNDVLIILYYIEEQIEQYGDITKVPLTNTGRVRNYVRNNCLHYNKNHRKEGGGKIKRYRELMQECVLNIEEYILLKQAFMGGFTHASLLHVGELLKDVDSIDFTSSYPYVMLSELFPMSRPMKVDLTDFDLDEAIKDKHRGFLFTCALYNVHSDRTFETYLSESKCTKLKGEMINNGRVFKADYIETTITDIDYQVIKQCYNYDKIEIITCYEFYMQYLPKQIIESILDLYEGKTTLKGVEGKETEYLVKKGMLNSVYGMCVTDIIRDEITYTDKWDVNKITTLADMQEQLDKYNNSKRRFLYYPWGIWVTAYARKNLWNGILKAGTDYVYADTDSIKLLNKKDNQKWIDEYNKECEQKLHKMCDFRKIDFERCKPKTIKGKEKLIGVFDDDGHYKYFKTLGAKRYMYIDDNDKLHITIAGLSKRNGVDYLLEKYKTPLEVLKNFDDDLYIPPESTGKNTHTYLDEENECSVMDYQGNECVIKSLSSVHLEKAQFTLSIAKRYAEFLEEMRNGYLYMGVRYI